MSEREFFGVQELAVEVANSRAELWILNGVVAAAAVSFVADHGMF